MPDPVVQSGFALPFKLTYPKGALAGGGPLVAVGRCREGGSVDGAAVVEALRIFNRLAATGALAGGSIAPGKSGLLASEPSIRGGTEISFNLDKCAVDEGGLVVLAHLFSARRASIPLTVLEISGRADAIKMALKNDPEGEESTYPEIYRKLPFALEDEDPGSGAYTLTGELEEQLNEANQAVLQDSLAAWVDAVRAGAYAIAPIPPEKCYCEPDSDEVVSFETTVEWIVFKVQADPACIFGLVNLFAAFHERCQKIRKLTIA